jgi:hypothetical protein
MLAFKRRLALGWLLLAWLCAAALPAHAHDPFDGNVQMLVHADRIEAKITLGYDAARIVFRASGLAPADAARLTRPGGGHALVPLPASVAAGLLVLSDGARRLQPVSVQVAPSDVESNVFIVFPRPAADDVQVATPYFESIADMRAGTLVVADEKGHRLASRLLSRGASTATVPLARGAGQAVADAFSGFGAFFKLGVEHILTGYDHLLFLAALLLSLRGVRPMIGIVTAFTVAHSVTLALAAFGVVTVRPAVVEPLIAASIIVACVANLARLETPALRCWMAGGFGLIHGFGFAGALREATLAQGGGNLAVPLAAFNLGVETGQLAVAAVCVPLLLSARHRPAFVRYGLPALSIAIIAVSGVWLAERLQA